MSRTDGLLNGVKDILTLATSAGVFGLVYGMTSRQLGFPLWSVLMMSFIIFAGSSQFIAVNSISSGSSIPATILTVAVVNLRMLLLSAAMNDAVKNEFSLTKRLIGSFFLTDETFVTYYASLENSRPSMYRYVGSALTMYSIWIVSCYLGYISGSLLPITMARLLSFAFPASFASILAMQIDSKETVIAVCIAAIASLICYLYFPGKLYIIIGCVVGSLAGASITKKENK